MNAETLLVSIFFLVPGLLSLLAFEWVLVSGERSGFERTGVILTLGLLAAAPLALLPFTRALVTHLWSPGALSENAFWGLLLQSLIGIGLGVGAGHLIRKHGLPISKTLYRRADDWLWANHADDSRYVLVTTVEGRRYWGALEFAQDPSLGRDLVLRDAGEWIEDAQDFFRNGMKYLLLPGESIRSIELSVANPVEESDRPVPVPGFVGEPQSEMA